MTNGRPGRTPLPAALRRRTFGPADKTVAALVGLALVGGAGVVGYEVLKPCGDGLEARGGECVGATLEAGVGLEGEDEEVARLVGLIAEENEKVREAREEGNASGYKNFARIGLLTAFKGSDRGAMSAETVRNSLRGVYLAQVEANTDNGKVKFQIDMGNAGSDLSSAEEAVKGLQREDPDIPLVGVVGLGRSDKRVARAVRKLDDKGFPTVGAAASSPSMGNKTQSFFGLSPSNEDYIEKLSVYAAEQRLLEMGEKVVIAAQNHEGGEDVYAEDLEEGLSDKFENSEKAYYDTEMDAGGTAAPGDFTGVVEKACGASAILYAGRDVDFPALVQQLSNITCKDGDNPELILRVSTGMPSELSDEELNKKMAKAGITTVVAAAVDGRIDSYQSDWKDSLTGEGEKVYSDIGMGDDGRIDDGYAILHFEATKLVAHLAEDAARDAEEKDLTAGSVRSRLPVTGKGESLKFDRFNGEYLEFDNRKEGGSSRFPQNPKVQLLVNGKVPEDGCGKATEWKWSEKEPWLNCTPKGE